MDEFLELFTSPNRMSWPEEAPQSAFHIYTHQAFEELPRNPNANKKMIEFLKNNTWVGSSHAVETMEEEKDRSLKHKMRERMRRQKHKQIYVALHELLPSGTKSNKKSILESASREIDKLQHYKEELRKKNGEMEMILSAEKAVEKAEIKLKVAYPASGVDSMLEVLKCLKNTGGCTITAMQSSFSHHEFSATVEFETKMRASDVERAVQRTLFDVEKRFRDHQLLL